VKAIYIVGAIIAALIVLKLTVLSPKSKDNAQGSGGGAPPSASNAQGGKPSGGPGGGGPGGGGKPMPVDVLIAKETSNSSSVFSSGTLVANEEVDLRSEASGILTNLFIKEGTLVSKGQLIAKINDADIKARIKKLNYEEELAKQTEARQKKLLDINAISKEEYDLAVNKINTLSADKESLMVALKQTEVRAPFTGKIGLKSISVGAYLSPSVSIARLIQTNPIKMDFTIPEKYSSRVKLGTKVMMSTDGSNEERQAIVTAIDPKIDEALRTIKVRTTLPNANGALVPGMFVKVKVPLGAAQTIMLPTESIIPFAGGKKVYVVRNGKAKEASINSGMRTERELEVISGIKAGDTIIISGLMNIKDGQGVKPKVK
jgi:membrane fusion protein, multidrug efflux system